jgi:glycosyltransferase involved in cell wall biosynthesis
MNINYTMVGTQLNGGIRVLLEIANGLVNRGHNVTITSLGNENDHQWFPLKAEINYIKKPFIKKLLAYSVRKSFEIETYPYQEIMYLSKAIPDCDINVATFWYTAFSVFNSQKGIPFYHMQHYEPLFIGDNYQKKLVEQTYYLPLNKIANSIWLEEQIREKYGYNIPIVNPAIDHSVFYPRDVSKETGELRVVCFGKQIEWKGFKDALNAMKIVMENKPNVEFMVYGAHKPSSESDVPYTFVEYPSDDELAKIYSSADVVFCPSWYESFPLPPIEAMACGAPVVTTRYGTEDYAFNEENSLVVLPQNPKLLAEAILRLLDDESLRESFRKKGQKKAKQFTWDKTVDNLETLFKNTLKKVDE